MPGDPSWVDFREEVFGPPYLVWHDGPDFEALRGRYAADPAFVTRMIKAGLRKDDPVAAQSPRELVLDAEQRGAFVALLEAALRFSDGDFRTEVAASLFVLTGSEEYAQPIVEVLAKRRLHWGIRLNAAIRLRLFRPTEEIVAVLAAGVRDRDYLVRYHSASTLLAYAGRQGDVGEHPEFFSRIVDAAADEQRSAAADELVALVPVEP